MNNTKVAVIFGNKRPHLYYVNHDLGLVEAFRSLPRNYHVEFFMNTSILGAIHKEKHLLWFKNTTKSMRWGVNQYFEPNVVVCIGSPNYEWEKIVDGDYKKIFIYDSYDLPKKNLNWDAVIVPTKEDLQYYPKAIVASVYNSNLYKADGRRKHFTRMFPQLVHNLDLFLNIEHMPDSVSMNEAPDLFYLSDFPSTLMNDFLNQSKVTCLLEKDNDIELALSSMACQVPVVTVVDNKAAFIGGTYPSLATTPYFTETLQDALLDSGRIEFDLKDFTIEAFNKKLKKLL
jgi:hypothetical protein